jgi:hypothetical protein
MYKSIYVVVVLIDFCKTSLEKGVAPKNKNAIKRDSEW